MVIRLLRGVLCLCVRKGKEVPEHMYTPRAAGWTYREFYSEHL